MKTRLALLAILSFALAVIPAAATTYSNGPCNCDLDAFTISAGYSVSDSFTTLSQVGSYSFWVWAYPGDSMGSLGWSVGMSPYGADKGSGTATTGVNNGGGLLSSQFVSSNAYGYDIDLITVTGLAVSGLNPSNSYWLTLQSATDPTHPTDPFYWDENYGVGCTSPGCPSQAYESAYGTVASEAFSISDAHGASTPEPGSIALLGSGVLGLAGMLRRRFFG
jgi:PEP-CTERM motif